MLHFWGQDYSEVALVPILCRFCSVLVWLFPGKATPTSLPVPCDPLTIILGG